jgi:hypothetical protein
MEISEYEIEAEMTMRLKKALRSHHEILVPHPSIAYASQELKPCVIYVLLIASQ